jgi:hypothetical protein
VSHDHNLRAAAGVGSAGAVSVGAAPFVVVSVGFTTSSFLSAAGFSDFFDLKMPVDSRY